MVLTMPSLRHKAAAAAAAVVLIAAALATVAIGWTRHDPLYFLPRSAGAPAAQFDWAEHRAGRVVEHVTLLDARLGPIGFVVSLPDPLPDRRLPVVLALGGLGTGEHNIRAISDASDNVVVGYDWPLASATLKRMGVRQVPALRTQALSVPGQVAAALRWVLAQPWGDAARVSLVGFSLGAVAAPAVQRVAAAEHIPIGWTVLAYGGAPIDALVSGDTRLRPGWARPAVALAAELLLVPIEPSLHLPGLKGRFLVLRSADDTIVAEQASLYLETLTPEPKRTILLPGGHVGTGADRAALLEVALSATRSWLVAEGAVNSHESSPAEIGSR